jgi:hypothetical protein
VKGELKKLALRDLRLRGKQGDEGAKRGKIPGMALIDSHPAEKGACENTNYLIRDMLYPVDDFRKLTRRDVSRIAGLLNERPRKTLGFRTPYEVFS